MREIMFRGKDKRSGEWEWGGYFNGVGAAHIVAERLGGFVEMVEVDPETVGEYTGKKAKGGKRVYTGDALRYFDDEIQFVEWNEKVCRVMLHTFRAVTQKKRGKIETTIVDGWAEVDDYPLGEMEIVGNIHDNPELLLLKRGAE